MIELRQLMALIAIIACGSASCYIFWEEELQYYRLRSYGPKYVVNDQVVAGFIDPDNTRPIFVHFFDNDCVDSRINLEHLQLFADRYKEQYDFYVIDESGLGSDLLHSRYDLPAYMMVIDDVKHQLSQQMGVYTTPHAFVLNGDRQLYFSGNYNNQFGICGAGDIGSSAPAIAMRFLSEGNQAPIFPTYQTSFTGCTIN